MAKKESIQKATGANIKEAPEQTPRADVKERVFASPKTGDDTEENLPSLEKLATGYNSIPFSDGELILTTKEDILARGTLLQKLRLFVSNINLSGYFEAKELLSNDEVNKIKEAIKTKKDRELAELCLNEYRTISKFGRSLSFFFKRFQTSFAILAKLLNQLDHYESIAKRLTVIAEDKSEIINDLLSAFAFDGSTLKYNEESKTFYIDTTGEGNLYDQIQREAKSATKDLSDFKAYAVVAEQFFINSTLKFTPIAIQTCIHNAEEERYARYLVSNLRYFRSELNQRKARGERITAEEERYAVIPDYCEVKPSKNVLEDCKAAIKEI